MVQTSEKPEKTAAASVAIDGARIRGVREANKLTQLYVASVVGVTTDTISRWENNRYPSIKRENAEKLAGALEVDLAEILRQEELGETSEEAQPVPAARRARRPLLWGLAALLLVLPAVSFFTMRPTPAPTAIRWAPRFAAPGEIVPVRIQVTLPAGEAAGFILKEKLPQGVRLLRSLPASSAAESSGSVIKWLIPGGSASATVSYTVQVPASPGFPKEVKFDGEIVHRAQGANRTEAVGGANGIRIGAYHWADSNADGRIDDDEIMPAYYICDEMKGLGLDWDTIEAIWGGKGYTWNQQGGFSVVK